MATTKSSEVASKRVTFLPEPEPREAKYLVISVDDHVVEPPWMFEGRMPAKYQDRVPRVVDTDDGAEAWVYEDALVPNFSVHATVGRPIEETGTDPDRFEHMRRGCWDIHDRVKDMDINGIYASLCFPSKLAGFGGYRFSTSKDLDFGLEVLRAYNDWHLEEWAGTYPGRIIPCQIPWLADPALGADEIRRNADRGFTSVTFPDNPEHLGLPSMHSGHWDPILEACAETGTVVCLHIGSAAWIVAPSKDAPADTRTVLFPVNAVLSAVDWLYSMRPVMFPDLQIVLAEGGIGWVPMLLDRLDFCVADNHLGYRQGWASKEYLPSEILKRNFWFPSIEDPTVFRIRDRIGVENIMVECDYPHADSTWPDTQLVLEKQLGGLPRDEADLITHGNAARLFRHPLPSA